MDTKYIALLICLMLSGALAGTILVIQAVLIVKKKSEFMVLSYIIPLVVLTIGLLVKNYEKHAFDVVNLCIILTVPIILLALSLLLGNLLDQKSKSGKTIQSIFKLNIPIINEMSSIIVIPVLEELFFRQILFQVLSKSYCIGSIIVITSVFFSLSHMGKVKCIGSFIGGLALATIYAYTYDIMLVILVHSTYNSLCRFTRSEIEKLGGENYD